MLKYLLGFIFIFSFLALLPADKLEAYLDQGRNTSIEHWNDSNFDKAIANGVVVVDFYADWCGPCRKFGPTFEQVANEMGGKAVFGKVNVDTGKGVARKHGIKSIPTVIIFKDGKEMKRGSSFVNAYAFSAWLESAF